MLTIGKDPSDGGKIQIDHDTPDDGYRDLIGQIRPASSGATAPSLGAFRGSNIQLYSFAANDVIEHIVFHLPHDYSPGTELYLHVHWGHNGTAITGNFNINWYAQYAKGYEQETFNSELTIPQSIACDIGTYPQYQHNISEFQLTNDGGDATHLDRNIIEVDGLLIIGLEVTGIPTITGGSPNQPFIFTADLHYQSTGVQMTKNKNYPFYT